MTIEDLKCCSNCRYHYNFDYTCDKVSIPDGLKGWDYCGEWKWDTCKQSDRRLF